MMSLHRRAALVLCILLIHWQQQPNVQAARLLLQQDSNTGAAGSADPPVPDPAALPVLTSTQDAAYLAASNLLHNLSFTILSKEEEPDAPGPDAKPASLQVRSQVLAAAAPTDDFLDQLTGVMKDVCWQQSGIKCEDVDVYGTTDWWKKYFPSLQTMRTESDITAIDPVASTSLPTRASYQTFLCPYNPTQSYKCRMDAQDISSHTVQVTTTRAYSYQKKAGIKIKAKLNVGVAIEAENEITLDLGYSWSDSTATSTVYGTTSIVSLSVAMNPDDKQCTSLSTIMTRVKTSATAKAWTCASGWLGASQNPYGGDRTRWQGQLINEPSSHRYRAFYIPYLVKKAKDLNILSAEKWLIDEKGRACMENTLTFQFDLAANGYVDPQRPPAGSPECDVPLAQKAALETAMNNMGSSGELNAVPVTNPGSNTPVP